MTRIRTRRAVATVLLGAVLTVGGRAAADEFPMPKVDFSADSMTHLKGMNVPSQPGQPAAKDMDIPGKMYQSGEKSRQEVSMGGMQQTIINRRDKKVVWMIMPAQKSYMEFNADDPKMGKKEDFQNFWKSHDAKMEKIGKEDVNGVETTHSKVTIASATPDGHAFSGEVWLTKDNIPMRMKTSPSSGGEVVMELSNLKVGKQDPSLFEVPEGYNKMQMPDLSGMAGAMQGSQAPGGAKGQMTPEQMKQLQEQLKKQMEQMQKNMPKPPAAPAAP
ncbi:MAG: DUF4412 domain-containing protein [Deltaproteobacteria bacterium]|nr:DUF4412 domain-containing protein [Deltaproteobacteria bacterium]